MFHGRASKKTMAASKMKSFVVLVGGFKPLTNVTKNFSLGVAAVLDPPR